MVDWQVQNKHGERSPHTHCWYSLELGEKGWLSGMSKHSLPPCWRAAERLCWAAAGVYSGARTSLCLRLQHCGHKSSRCRSEMNVQAAWRRGYTGKNVVVTILDDGIERNHPDLVDNYVSPLLEVTCWLSKHSRPFSSAGWDGAGPLRHGFLFCFSGSTVIGFSL